MKTIVHNPFDRSPIAEVALVDWAQIDEWLNEAQLLHRERSCWLAVHERIAILRRTADIMVARGRLGISF